MIVPSAQSRKFLEKATSRYEEALTEDHDAWRYLTQERSLEPDTIRRFRLGVVDEPLASHETYEGRLSIPYLAPDGDVLSIRYRRLGETGPKYMTAPGDTPRPFNTAALEVNASRIVVCEGELDTITAAQVGLPAIGVPGATSWRPEWSVPLEQYDVVYVLADNDDQGEGRKMGETIASQLDNVRLVLLPKGHDVNSLFCAEGAEAIWKLVEIKE